MQKEYTTEISSIQDKSLEIKQAKRSLLLKKLAFIGLVIVLLTIINSFELLSSGGSAALTLVSTILIIVYFIIV